MPEQPTCPFCGKTLEPATLGRLEHARRPWPILPWKLLGWVIGLLGLAAAIAAPALSLMFIVAAFWGGFEPELILAIATVPVGVLAMAMGIGIIVVIVGGAAALVAVILGALLRPPHGFAIHPFTHPAPQVWRSWLLERLLRMERRMKPAFGEKQQSIVGVGVVVFLLIAVPLSLLETGGWQAACISGLSAMFWGVGWSWWLTLVAEGPSWFVGLMDPTYAKKRRAAFPKRADWTERDDFVAGTVLGPLGDMLEVPDGGEPAIAWHARGRSKSHVIDDAALVSFLMLTDDDERVAVIASREVLIELDPSERGVLDSPFLTQRGFGVAPPDRLMLRRLEIGHRVEVSGSAGEMRDPDAGYRGGMLRTLEAGEAPLVVCYASSS